MNYIYLIQEQEAPHCFKIGVSKNPEARMKALGIRPKIIDVWELKGEAYPWERNLHRYFKNRLIKNEWFKDISSKDISKAIDSMAAKDTTTLHSKSISNITVKLPFKSTFNAADMFERLYSPMTVNGKAYCLGETLGIKVTRTDTGLLLQKYDGTNKILSLNIYDKRAQMLDTKRTIPADMPKEWEDSPRFDIRFFRRELGIILKTKGYETVDIKSWSSFAKNFDQNGLKKMVLDRALNRLYFFDLIKDVEPLHQALSKTVYFNKWKNSIRMNKMEGKQSFNNICSRLGFTSELGCLAYDIVDHACKESAGTLKDLQNRTLHKRAAGTNHFPAREWFAALASSVRP